MKKDMLKTILCILSLAMILCACACAGKEATAAQETATAEAPAVTAPEEKTTEGASAATVSEEKTEEAKVDLDLSVMSGTIVYSQVYNMMYDPKPFLNKVIKVAGYYTTFEDTALGTVYHACMIPDAAACCAQGLEFVWAGDHALEEYPAETTDITVTGRLEMYVENGASYLHLVDADLKW